ncbi:MAG: kelch repeat-containing protein [Oscillochloridaceae bacterium umkhey_bin13]
MLARRTLLILVAGLLLSLIPPHTPITATGLSIPPLPRGCGRGFATIPDFATALCCVSGYVYWNGAPVEGAEVTLSLGERSMTVTTRREFGVSQPAYFARLDSATGLNAQPGDTITVTARFNGQEQTQTFVAYEGGQQEDIVLPRIAFESNWVRGERATPSFKASALAYDATNNVSILFGGLQLQGFSEQAHAETWAWDGRSWTRLVPFDVPPARSGHSMSYDTLRERVVLFGGVDRDGTRLSDTWEWDGSRWSQRASTGPIFNGGMALSYDSTRGRVLLVGATSSNAANLETWAWNGSAWTLLAPARTPPARSAFALAYDQSRDRLVLFSGLRSGVLQDDLWEYDGTTWSQSYPLGGPTPRRLHALIYDPARGGVLLIGGVTSPSNVIPNEDTWLWDGTNWSELRVDLPPRANALVAYDQQRGVPILAGGTSTAGGVTFLSETWELDAIDWNRRAPHVGPNLSDTFHAYAIAPQPARQRLVLFLGSTNNDRLRETWEWDGMSWTPRTPATNPPTRVDHALVYDEARNHVVLFGGKGYNGVWLADTWTWDGHTWTPLNPSSAPAARGRHTLAYDAAQQQIVLFGGWYSHSAGTTYLRDTWLWNGTTWSEAVPSNAPTAAIGKLAYDRSRAQTVFLGSGSIWEWDGTNWARRTTQSPTGSTFSNYVQLGYDSVQQRIIAFGGSPSAYIYPQDTWAWDDSAWQRLTPATVPPGRKHHVMTYDPVRQRLLMFGGMTESMVWHDLWEWDGQDWRKRADMGQPVPHSASGMAYMHDGVSLLFGGRITAGALSQDTLVWQGSTWLYLDLPSSPPARESHQLARNADGSQILLFGGLGTGNTYLDDTWLWDGSTWLPQELAQRPPARSSHRLSYDTQRNVWVLFGGRTATSYLGDTWEYDGTTWSLRSLSPAPAPRVGASLSYDVRRGMTVLVGGQNSSGLLNDVWEYDGTSWRNVTPAITLGPRAWHASVYDRDRGVVVVTGGRDDDGVRSDSWEWDGTEWRERVATRVPSPRSHHAVAYDELRGELIAFGGQDAAGVALNDTWLHQTSGSYARPIPIATINRLRPRDARQGSDTITLAGSGADQDATNLITAYRWSYLDDQGRTVVFSDQRSLNLPADALPRGMRTILLEVRDDEGDWSQPVEEPIFIRGPNAEGPAQPTWTLLIYAAADNDLDPWMGLNPDVNGMLHRLKQAGPQDRVQVAMLYDGPGPNDTRRYTLSRNTGWQEASQPEARMDEPATLRDFIIWGFEALPRTDHYVLAIVDHANGVVGIAQDESSPAPPGTQAFLTPVELRNALDQATTHMGRKLDVIHYDGCSFGLYETAASADGFAHYVIASPTTAWGLFAYAQYQAHASVATSPKAYALAAAQTYADRIERQQLAYTIAVYDMAQFAHLQASVSVFGDQLLTYLTADRVTRAPILHDMRNAAQKYDSGGLREVAIDNEDAYVDIVDLAERVQQLSDEEALNRAATALIAAVQGDPAHGQAPFVAYARQASFSYRAYDPSRGVEDSFMVDLARAHGVGIFYPPRATSSPDSAYVAYIQHRLFPSTRDNGWTRFLTSGLAAQPSSELTELSTTRLLAPLLPSPQGFAPLAEPQRVWLPLIRRSSL